MDKLAAEVRRHRNAVCTDGTAGAPADGVAARRRRRERDFGAAAPHLRAARRADDPDGFFDVLRPLLRPLRDHGRRELILAQMEGNILPGELTVGDLLDEVLLRSRERWDRQPNDEPLDRWLVRLLHEVLDELGFRPPDEQSQRRHVPSANATKAESIYQRLREDDPHAEPLDGAAGEMNPDAPYGAENGWAVENTPYWPFVDSLMLDDVIPAENSIVPAQDSSEPWVKLAEEEQRRLILDALRQLPRDQRRAFTLNVLEGWSVKETAAALNRQPDQVREDIQAVRRALRERLEKSVS